MKKSRHQKIIDLVQHTRIATQEELADVLNRKRLFLDAFSYAHMNDKAIMVNSGDRFPRYQGAQAQQGPGAGRRTVLPAAGAGGAGVL